MNDKLCILLPSPGQVIELVKGMVHLSSLTLHDLYTTLLRKIEVGYKSLHDMTAVFHLKNTWIEKTLEGKAKRTAINSLLLVGSCVVFNE